MSQSPRLGAIYVATCQQKYIDEACISASSLKQAMPDLSVTLLSDQTIVESCFDQCIPIQSSRNGILDKSWGMLHSPYDYTIYLDTDTYICEDFSEIFTLLEKFDIGAALNEHRTGLLGEISWDYQTMKDIQGRWIYPIYNGGVIVYKRSPAVMDFLSHWFTSTRQLLLAGNNVEDQTSLQILLHESDLRTVVLPPEYNCRFIYPVSVCGTVKILHGRHPDLSTIAQEINSSIHPRIFHPKWGLISGSGFSMIQKAVKTRINTRSLIG